MGKQQFTPQQVALLHQLSTGEFVLMVGGGTGNVYIGRRDADYSTFEQVNANTFSALVHRHVGLLHEFTSPRDTFHHWYELTESGRAALAAMK